VILRRRGLRRSRYLELARAAAIPPVFFFLGPPWSRPGVAVAETAAAVGAAAVWRESAGARRALAASFGVWQASSTAYPRQDHLAHRRFAESRLLPSPRLADPPPSTPPPPMVKHFRPDVCGAPGAAPRTRLISGGPDAKAAGPGAARNKRLAEACPPGSAEAMPGRYPFRVFRSTLVAQARSAAAAKPIFSITVR